MEPDDPMEELFRLIAEDPVLSTMVDAKQFLGTGLTHNYFAPHNNRLAYTAYDFLTRNDPEVKKRSAWDDLLRDIMTERADDLAPSAAQSLGIDVMDLDRRVKDKGREWFGDFFTDLIAPPKMGQGRLGNFVQAVRATNPVGFLAQLVAEEVALRALQNDELRAAVGRGMESEAERSTERLPRGRRSPTGS